MIEIKYNHQAISITGHANFADHGNDIVCAGVSTAFFYTCELLSRFDNNNEVKIKADNELFKIVINDTNKELKTVLDSFVAILNELSTKYKKNIKIMEVNKNDEV